MFKLDSEAKALGYGVLVGVVIILATPVVMYYLNQWAEYWR